MQNIICLQIYHLCKFLMRRYQGSCGICTGIEIDLTAAVKSAGSGCQGHLYVEYQFSLLCISYHLYNIYAKRGHDDKYSPCSSDLVLVGMRTLAMVHSRSTLRERMLLWDPPPPLDPPRQDQPPNGCCPLGDPKTSPFPPKQVRPHVSNL